MGRQRGASAQADLRKPRLASCGVPPSPRRGTVRRLSGGIGFSFPAARRTGAKFSVTTLPAARCSGGGRLKMCPAARPKSQRCRRTPAARPRRWRRTGGVFMPSSPMATSARSTSTARLPGPKYLGPLKNPYGYAASLAVWGNNLLIQLDQGETPRGRVETNFVAGRQRTGLVGAQPARAGVVGHAHRHRSGGQNADHHPGQSLGHRLHAGRRQRALARAIAGKRSGAVARVSPADLSSCSVRAPS